MDVSDAWLGSEPNFVSSTGTVFEAIDNSRLAYNNNKKEIVSYR